MMTKTMKKLTAEDVYTLQQLSIETYMDTFDEYNSEENMTAYLDSAYDIDKLTKEINHLESEFYFLYDNDQLTGYLKINTGDAQSEAMGEHALEVERIYIRSNSHKKGYGKLLLNKAVDLAKAKGKDEVWLGVWEHNDNALAFYKKYGFIESGSHAFYMGDDRQIDLIMKLSLSEI